MVWLNDIQREISVCIVEECVTLQTFHYISQMPNTEECVKMEYYALSNKFR